MSILNSLINPVTKLLDKVIEDKDQKNAIAFELSTMAEKHAQELAKGQLDVNKVEAAHKNYLLLAGDLLWAGYAALAWRVTSLLSRWLILRWLYPVLQSQYHL